MRRILKTLGLTPQRPKHRATNYNPGDVQKRKDEEFPRILQCSKKLGAMIVFADESGLSSQCVYGQVWCVAGKTLGVRVTNSRFRLDTFVAISPEGEIYYMIHEG